MIVNKKRFLIFIFIFSALLIAVSAIIFTHKSGKAEQSISPALPVNIEYSENLTAEINSKTSLLSFVKRIDNGKIFIADSNIDTSELGEKALWIAVKDLSDNIITSGFKVNITDSTPPQINCKNTVYTTVGNPVNLLKNVTVSDNSNESISPTVSGYYSFENEGAYALKYTACDSSGNTSVADFKLIVSPKGSATTVASSANTTSKKPYYLIVNRANNTVMVYSLSETNEYTILAKTFICSVGTDNNTPTGTFLTSDKYVWRKLSGNVYGQYATRITGSILFHSVPYFSQNKADLEYEEYNKLGTKASLGCVRLSVADAKWIYDNCPKSTTVKICDGDLPEGLVRPSAQTIDVNSPMRGWDPTDPDSANPYKTK